MFPLLTTRDLIDLDLSVNFSSFSAQEVQTLIEMMTTEGFNPTSSFTSNLMVLIFIFTSITLCM